jgi:hypothetical protein
MGLFSTIGSFFGPIGTAVGAVGDALAGHKAKKDQVNDQNALDMQKYVRLRKAAEDGGFHPLEALRSGGSVPAAAAPRLFSTLSASNAFDALEDEITGEAARERRRQEVIDEINERELERAQQSVARGVMTTPTLATNRPPRLPGGAAAGDTRGAMGAEGLTSTVTDVSGRDINDPERWFSDPHRVDFGVLTERWGESELVEALAFPFNAAFDAAYTSRVRSIAEVTGRTPLDVHQDIAENGPKRARELFGLVLNDAPPAGSGNHPLSREFWGFSSKEPADNKPRLPLLYPPLHGRQ